MYKKWTISLWSRVEPKQHCTTLLFQTHEFNWKVIYLSSIRGVVIKHYLLEGIHLAQTISENTSTVDWCCMAVQWWYGSSWGDEVSKLPHKPDYIYLFIHCFVAWNGESRSEMNAIKTIAATAEDIWKDFRPCCIASSSKWLIPQRRPTLNRSS